MTSMSEPTDLILDSKYDLTWSFACDRYGWGRAEVICDCVSTDGRL